jgi:hypothetical protein
MSLDELSAIKSKKMYFAVSDGKVYMGDIYGKINLLYTMSYSHSYSSGMAGVNGGMASGSTSTVSKSYYLQKQGSDVVDKFNRTTFLDYVSDNEDALIKAKAHYIWTYTSYASFAGYIGGAIYLISAVNKDGGSGNYGKPIAIVVGTAVLHGVLTSIADHKLKKAIYIYNGIE